MLTTAERIIKNTVYLQREKPFFSYLLMSFKVDAVDPKNTDIPTAGVNKYGNLFWNENFFSKLSDEEMRGVLCHEVLHLAKGDFFRSGKREAMIWNVASDCVINHILVEEGFKLPGEAYIPESNGNIKIGKKTYNVSGKTTEQFYDEIISDIEMIKVYVNGKGGGKRQPGKGQGHGGFDVHLEGDKDDKGNSTGQEKEGSASSKAAESVWKRRTVEAATVAKQRGACPGFANELIDGILNPKIDWRTRIKNFVTDEIPVDYDNRAPGRKFYGTGVWAPRIKRENIEVFISIDCSGSTSGDRVDFASEAVGILTSHAQVNARLICWDTEVDPHNDIEVDTNTVDKLIKMNLENISGGTELSSYTRYLEKKRYQSRVHIILTDGYIESEPVCPRGTCLFVLTKGGSDEIIKKYGEVCYLSDVERE